MCNRDENEKERNKDYWLVKEVRNSVTRYESYLPIYPGKC
jgi:hypothetical protein